RGLASGLEDTKLVAFRISEDDPRLLALADVGAGGPEAKEAIHRGVPVVGPEVEVQTVLECLRFRNTSKQKSGQSVRCGPNLELLLIVVDDDPLQSGRPPASEPHRVGGVHDDLLPLQRHQLNLSRPARSPESPLRIFPSGNAMERNPNDLYRCHDRVARA